MEFLDCDQKCSGQMCMKIISCNPTVDCGAPPSPVNGSFLQPHTNTTEGSVAVFQCDPGFVPEGEMTAECGSDGQWTPNPRGVTCSPRPTQMFTQIVTQVSILTSGSTSTGPGKKVCNTWAEVKYKNLIIIILKIVWVTYVIQMVDAILSKFRALSATFLLFWI